MYPGEVAARDHGEMHHSYHVGDQDGSFFVSLELESYTYSFIEHPLRL